MGVGPEDEFGEGWWGEGAVGTAGGEAGVAEGGGGVDADEEEEGAAEEEVEAGVGGDVGQDPVFSPAFGDEVEEGVDVGEGEASGAFFVGDGGEETAGVIWVFGAGGG